jgi:hypothetical protein
VIGAVLAPERGETREIGFRGLFPAAGLRYDLTLFDARSNGFNTTRTCTAAEQAALNGGATCTINEAAGQLATRGLESMSQLGRHFLARSGCHLHQFLVSGSPTSSQRPSISLARPTRRHRATSSTCARVSSRRQVG